MKLKIFSLQTSNRKPSFDDLEADVNTWVADNPNVIIERTNALSQPSAAWSHFVVAVWYSEK